MPDEFESPDEELKYLRAELEAERQSNRLGSKIKAFMVVTAVLALVIYSFNSGALTKLISREVQTGEIVSCKHCQKEISNSVQKLSVPGWKAKEYRVVLSSTLCQSCGDEMIQYKVAATCKRCGAEYASGVEYALRKDNPHNITLGDNYCSPECEQSAKVSQRIDNVSRKTGESIGRFGKGLLDGVKKASR